jgi:hypothetical protein
MTGTDSPISDHQSVRTILAAVSLDTKGQHCLRQACRQATLTGAVVDADGNSVDPQDLVPGRRGGYRGVLQPR